MPKILYQEPDDYFPKEIRDELLGKKKPTKKKKTTTTKKTGTSKKKK